MIRDAGIKLAHKMYKEDGFIPDVIYDSLRGGAYLANVISEYYKLQCSKINREPVFYAAVVARSYGKLVEHTNKVDIDGWTWSPNNLKKGQKVRITQGKLKGLEAYVQRISGKKALIGNEIRYVSGATIEINRAFLELVTDEK